jgi:transposase
MEQLGTFGALRDVPRETQKSMRATSLLRAVLGWEHTRVTGFDLTADNLTIDVAPTTRTPRCSGCLRRVRRVYDQRERRWRHVDFGGVEVYVRYSLRRLDCRKCGVVSELVPWAEHGVGFTREFEDVVGFLAQRIDKTSLSTLMCIAWETVGRIIGRVVARHTSSDRLDGLTHIGIDELSYRKHHEYVTVVSDLKRGRVVWVAPGKNAATVRQFFDALGPVRIARLEVVAIDMSEAYQAAVREKAPNAEIVFDRFHVQRLAHDALDEVRREQVRALRAKDVRAAKAIKNTRFAVQKNPWNLTQSEHEKLAAVQRNNRPLYRGHLLTHTLAAILDRRQVNVARKRLEEWCNWAMRSRLPPFKKVARTVRTHIEGILAYVATRYTNAVAEGLNGKIRTITRRSYGFHSVESLIAMIFLCCAGIVVALPHKGPLISTRRS